MAYELIRYEARGDVALVTLDRPDKLNAWTPAMSEELADAFDRANDDPSIGAIVMGMRSPAPQRRAGQGPTPLRRRCRHQLRGRRRSANAEATQAEAEEGGGESANAEDARAT